MVILYDNIIFSLQKAGGVSCVWKELISRAQGNNTLNCQFLEYKNSKENIYRNELRIDEKKLLTKNDHGLFIKKYLNPKINCESDFIFHSSYYRTCNNKYAKNVTTVHDFIYEYYRSGIPKFVHHRQKKNAILSSEAIICITNNTKKDLLKFFPSINEDRVFVIYNGVSEDFKLLENIKPTSDISKLGRYALYIGNRNQPHKNFSPIIDAIAHLNDLNLVLVGGGNLSEYEHTILNKRLNNRYFHFNNIDNTALNVLYNFAHVLLYPSIYEGFGIPIIEAQRAGCPVIAKHGSSITEVAQNSALLMDVGNSDEIKQKIIELEDSEFRNKLIKTGFANSQRFSWDKMADDVFNVYKTIL